MDDLDLIKQKINIIDLISEYLPLKKAGVNFKANCPFHQEKTASFMVSPERGIWHCFGCAKGGDIFKFLMEKEGIEFGESLEVLAKKAGITLRRRADFKSDKKQRLFEANQKAAQFFHYILTEHSLGKKALEYLRFRGVSDETIKQFNLGYAPNSWESLSKFLRKRGFSNQEMIDAGLSVPSKSGVYDRFRGRVIFPLLDVKSQIIGFAGRVLLTGEPKYINSPQTLIFDKSQFLFGINLTKGEIKQANQTILVEGEMDMIMSFQSGVKNVVACKGTALTSGQVELIKRFADTIILCFDMDLAGDSASRRGIELADAQGLNIKVIQIPDGKDPAELVQKDIKAWEEAVAEAEPIYDYYLKSVIKRFSPKTAEGKRRISQELLPIWKKINDPMTFEHYLQKLAALLGVSEELLRDQIQKYKPGVETNYAKTLKTVDISPTSSSRTRRELLEEYLLALLLRVPKDIIFIPSFPETIFLDEHLRSLYVFLVLYLDSISFKGKVFKIDEFTKLLPQELISLSDKLYLHEIDDKFQSGKRWQAEVNLVILELKKALVKASLQKLASDIKNAQTFGKIELLSILNRKFRDLSLKLKNL